LTYYYGKKDDEVTKNLDKKCDKKATFTKNSYIKGLVYWCDIK
jgi:hypothetical protein